MAAVSLKRSIPLIFPCTNVNPLGARERHCSQSPLIFSISRFLTSDPLSEHMEQEQTIQFFYGNYYLINPHVVGGSH